MRIAKSEISYPFVPKSTARLVPGQYWAIPLSNGKYGCGRVIQVAENSRTKSRVMFLAGVQEWVGTSAPTAQAIAGTTVAHQGKAHILAILKTGGEVLGCRPLEADGILPGVFLSHAAGPGVRLLCGLEDFGEATDNDRQTRKVLSTWGFKVAEVLAERLAQRGGAGPLTTA
jgi:hypothetical protein